nr:UPF0160 protein MYG1, mitochondrial [Pelodiscus sinensis]|eukprot:XP_006139170.1 UPF0160 protein MYG1, mitochondrial [Pelodiscus sinensis]
MHGRLATRVRPSETPIRPWTREPQLLSQCDVVVDVGGEYDPRKHRYDHHQRSFAQSMHCLRPDKPWTTKLSSAGLVYLHFGSQILAGLLELQEDDPVVQVLYDKVGRQDGAAPRARAAKAGLPLGKSHSLLRELLSLPESRVSLPRQVDPSGEILVFSQGGCPWKEHLFSLEEELGVEKPIKFVLYADQGGQWRVQCVPTGPHTFQNRLPLPEEWRGVRDEALSQLSGIPGCVFGGLARSQRGGREVLGALPLEAETLEAVVCASAAREEYVGQPLARLLSAGVDFCGVHQRTTDVAMLVTVFCWFAVVIAYVVYYVARNQAETRRHLEYLKALPIKQPSPEDEEEEGEEMEGDTLSTIL